MFKSEISYFKNKYENKEPIYSNFAHMKFERDKIVKNGEDEFLFDFLYDESEWNYSHKFYEYTIDKLKINKIYIPSNIKYDVNLVKKLTWIYDLGVKVCFCNYMYGWYNNCHAKPDLISLVNDLYFNLFNDKYGNYFDKVKILSGRINKKRKTRINKQKLLDDKNL
jgi:hypothetical protein